MFGEGKQGPEVKEGEFDLTEIGDRSGVGNKTWFPNIFKKKTDELILPAESSESKEIHNDGKLEKYIEKGILLDGLLRKEFSMKEINAFFLSYIDNLGNKYENFEGYTAFLGHGKQAGAMVHLLNLLIELKYQKSINTFQADIGEVGNFEIEVGSHNSHPENDKIVLFDYRNDMAVFSSGILGTKMGWVPKYGDSQIIDTFLIVNHLNGNNSSPISFVVDNSGKLDFSYNLDKEVSKMNKNDENIIETLLDLNIKMFEDFKVTKKQFHMDQFYKNFNKNNRIDRDLILNESHILILAAITLYKEIINSIDLENKKEIYLNYPNNLEFSLVYFIGLLIKKDFPYLDIITDKESLGKYIKSDDYDENNVLDIRIFNTRFTEDTFGLTPEFEEKIKIKHAFSIYSDKVEVKL